MKYLKTAAAIATVVALATSLAGCSQPAASPSASADKTLKIAYIQTGPLDYYIRGADGAKAAANSLNVDVQVFNSDNTPENETANVEDAIAQGVNGLIIFSVGKASLLEDLAKAKAAGIPAIVLYGYDQSIEDQAVGFIQAPTDVIGNQAGKWTADNVKSGEVAIIQGLLGRGDAESYTAGFKAGIASNPALSVVATVSADWDRAKAQSSMADILTAHPKLAAVFVQNDDMAIGAIAAIKAAGLEGKVKVVSQNGSPDGLAAVESGEISATVAWSPAQEAQMALARLVDSIRTGVRPQPILCNTPTVVITKANLGDAVPWVPTADSTKIGLASKCANK